MHPLRIRILKFISIAVALLLTTATGCTKFQALNALVPSGGYDRTADLVYGPAAHQQLDVYRPAVSCSPDREPGRARADVVVFFHGGDWQNGTKEDYRFVAQALTSRGYIAIIPDYRMYPEVEFPAFVRDGALAVKWAHDNAVSFGGDPQRLFVMGHSAGAHIAALLTLDPSYLRAIGSDRSIIHATVGLSGPYDFVPSEDDRAVFGMTPATTQPDAAIEPIHFATAELAPAPPMLLVQGERDTTVNPDNTTHLAAALRAAGSPVRFIDYPKADHVGVVLALAYPFRWLGPVLDDVDEYLQQVP